MRGFSYAANAALATAALGAAACRETVGDQHPVGGATATAAELERFVRRLHLDLTAAVPTGAELAAERDQLAAAGAGTAARRALAEQLVATPAFADAWIAELENRVYGGDTADGRYDFVCSLVRRDPPCDACADPTGLDPCAECDCPVLVTYAAERADLAQAAADLAAGASTSSIERRYADTDGFQALSGSVDGIAADLIEVFLGRTPQADELQNASAMVAGALVAGAPAGLLYHRYGSSYADLVDIVFSDEVYREAIATAAFERYLGRPPAAAELRHFAALVDAADPDMRPVILAITSSREYFQP